MSSGQRHSTCYVASDDRIGSVADPRDVIRREDKDCKIKVCKCLI